MNALAPAIFIMGPTASGKTALAMALHQHLPVELISVDSALIYRGMDIGTAKPTAEELAQVPHRLIDICDPSEAYSAENFRRDALAAMAEITSHGRIPLLVGGSMLYFRALQYGLSHLPASDPAIRSELEQQMQQQGLAALHAQLAKIDPQAAQRIHQNDPQRTLRALEVWHLTGQPISQLQANGQGQAMPYQAIKLVRAPAWRAVLHQRINQRFEQMLAQGFAREVETLRARGDLHADMPSMRSVGYRQLWQHLQGDYSWHDMVERGKAATRQLAKRQITWLRTEKEAVWLDEESAHTAQSALNVCQKTLERLNY